MQIMTLTSADVGVAFSLRFALATGSCYGPHALACSLAGLVRPYLAGMEIFS